MIYSIDLLKLCDETDLDILGHTMDTMVQTFQAQVLPVAGQLTARLVCQTYTRRDFFLTVCTVRDLLTSGEGNRSSG